MTSCLARRVEWTMTAVRGRTAQRHKEPDDRFWVQSIAWEQTCARFLSTARSLPSARGPETPLHRAQTQHFITLPPICLYVQGFYKAQWTKKKIRVTDVLLTMGEGAATHGFIQDRHEEHVAVFEIRFHLVNGLDPEIESNITLILCRLISEALAPTANLILSAVTGWKLLLPGTKSCLPSVWEDEDQIENLHYCLLHKTDLWTRMGRIRHQPIL